MSCAQAGAEHSRAKIKRPIVDFIFLSRQFLSLGGSYDVGAAFLKLRKILNTKLQQGVLSARFAILQIGEQ
jgi:hypothetical protein